MTRRAIPESRTAAASAARWAGHERHVRVLITIRLEILSLLDALAKQAGISRSAAVAELVRRAMIEGRKL